MPEIICYFRALFVVCDDNIRVYSTVTGKFIRGLEGTAGRKIIGQQCDRNNSKLLYGCTESGDIISWKWKSGVVNEKQALRFYGGTKATVYTFNLIELQDLSQAYGLITWRTKDSVKIQIGIFNLASGLQEDIQLPLKLEYVISNIYPHFWINSNGFVFFFFLFTVDICQ